MDSRLPIQRNKNEGHGHVYSRPDGQVTRCGGPIVCNVCQRDYMEALYLPPETKKRIPDTKLFELIVRYDTRTGLYLVKSKDFPNDFDQDSNLAVAIDRVKEHIKNRYFYTRGIKLDTINVFWDESHDLSEIIKTTNPKNQEPLKDDSNRCCLSGFIEKINNEEIKNLVTTMLSVYPNFFEAPAARANHHARKGGLLEHTCNMLKIAETTIPMYKHINSDYVYAGIILHDIGKSVENNEDFIGHIAEAFGTFIEHSKKLSEVDRRNIGHIILSHHGQLDWGSPIKPCTAEAMLVHSIDMLDAKQDCVSSNLNETKPGTFSEKIRWFGNSFWRKNE